MLGAGQVGGVLDLDDGQGLHFLILNTFQMSQLFSHFILAVSGVAVVPKPTLIFIFTCIKQLFLGYSGEDLKRFKGI